MQESWDEKFNAVFREYQKAHGYKSWYELADSLEMHEKVVPLIADTYGSEIIDSKEFKDWLHCIISEI